MMIKQHFLTWKLEEQIKDACIKVKTYDKRDAFKFEIINYPDLSGNIPTKPAYGSGHETAAVLLPGKTR